MKPDDRYIRLDGDRASRLTRSTEIIEIEDLGKRTEHELPVVNDRGFLWRLYIHWSCEEKDGGVYLQTELIALSRGLPAMFAWLANPYVSRHPTGVSGESAMRSEFEPKEPPRGIVAAPTSKKSASH